MKNKKFKKSALDKINSSKVMRTKKQISKKSTARQLLKQREPIRKAINLADDKKEKFTEDGYVKTGISGFDALMEKGIPKNTSLLIAGGAGTGKTILPSDAVQCS